ncbi:xanthine dehydrogenase accessory protein XdhC [Sneathiella sp.]|uniref:xanthine dehydrogenase accessory protein XdhC n=1 Tax=Sneathiella sp. TaxID=1964365 RepID=UPI0035676298
MSDWRDIFSALRANEDPAVLVTVGAVKGSTPRETGAQMLVTITATVGTIGGGRLEYLATAEARELLKAPDREAAILTFPLGPELAQCCGGHVNILLGRLTDSDIKLFNQLNENIKGSLLLSHWSKDACRRRIVLQEDAAIYLDKPLQAAIDRRRNQPGAEIVIAPGETGFTLVQSFSDAEFHITLFGAGHVGKAIVQALSPLPCALTWVDMRADEFPQVLPGNVTKRLTDSPAGIVTQLLSADFNLVMTHSHQLDLEICKALLRQAPPDAYIGLIGSKTKKVKFEKRLAQRGFDAGTIARITCPIGLDGLTGKRPAEIAASVATDLLLRHQQRAAECVRVKSTGANGP